MARRPLTAPLALAAAAVVATACDRVSSAAAERRADAEAAADSAARTALPPSLAGPLAIDPYLRDAYIAATPRAECVILSDAGAAEERRRVRAPLPDSSFVVAYVRATADDAELQRVEVLRRAPAGEQVGFIWAGNEDETSVVRWPNGVMRPSEQTVHPRGGPLPRVVRAVGRRVLTLRCVQGDAQR